MSLPERPDYDDRDAGYALVMPFVAVKSKDGPFDDDAFVAGFQAGALYQKLAGHDLVATTEMVYEALEEQVDLIAMARGLATEILWRGDGWIHVGFTRPTYLAQAVEPDGPCRQQWHVLRRVKRADRCPGCGEANE